MEVITEPVKQSCGQSQRGPTWQRGSRPEGCLHGFPTPHVPRVRTLRWVPCRVQVLPLLPDCGADIISGSEPPCLACQMRHMSVRRRRRGRGREAWAQGSTPHARLPHARGLTRDAKASTGLLLPLPLPPRPSREGQQPHPLPHCSLHSLLSVSPSVHLSSQWADWLPASLSIYFLDCHCARLSACDSVSLPVGCQASCGSDWLSICLSVCLSVGLPLCFPIKSVCPPNGQTGLPSLSPPVVRHHNCLSVCLSVNYSLIGQLAAHLSLSLSVCFTLSTWRSVSPAFPSVCLACYSPPPFLPACGAGFTHLKSTSLCRGPGLAAPSEAQQAAPPAQCDPQPPGQSLSPPSAPPPLPSPGVV